MSRLRIASDRSILALGADLKARPATVARGGLVRLGDDCGNLKTPGQYRRYLASIEALVAELGGPADIVAHDLHPQFISTRAAAQMGGRRVAVQHHHAHVAAVMSEHGVIGPLIGAACDGVGYGTDGAAWGCEFLCCDAGTFERIGHLSYFPLVGGDAAAIETWRPAAALLANTFGADWRRRAGYLFDAVDVRDLDVFEQMRTRGVNAPATSSLGRVFDAVSFLLGLCERNDFEAQAPMALESVCRQTPAQGYAYHTLLRGRAFELSLTPMFESIVGDLRAGVEVHEIAGRFHETLSRMISDAVGMACEMSGLDRAALSGGCFNNRRLLSRVVELLEGRKIRVIVPRDLPFGDGGLAIGQAAVAAANSKEV